MSRRIATLFPVRRSFPRFPAGLSIEWSRWLQVHRLSRLALALSLAFALLAGGSVYLALETIRAQAVATAPLAPVVVAAVDIPTGTFLAPGSVRSSFRIEQQPAALVPADAVVDVSVLESRSTTAPLRAGQRVLSSQLSQVSASSALTALIPPGQVAIVVPVNEQVSVGGAVGPTNRVDVIASVHVKQASGPPEMVTQALLRDVLVLAAGAQTSPLAPGGQAPRAYSSLTLALAPQDALVIQHLLSSNVRIVLALRHPGDDLASTQPVTTDEIARRFRLGDAR